MKVQKLTITDFSFANHTHSSTASGGLITSYSGYSGVGGTSVYSGSGGSDYSGVSDTATSSPLPKVATVINPLNTDNITVFYAVGAITIFGIRAILYNGLEISTVKFSIISGSSSGTANQNIWTSADDTINTDSNSRTVTTKVLTAATNPSTTVVEADNGEFTSTGYKLNYTTTASGRIWYEVSFPVRPRVLYYH